MLRADDMPNWHFEAWRPTGGRVTAPHDAIVRLVIGAWPGVGISDNPPLYAGHHQVPC